MQILIIVSRIIYFATFAFAALFILRVIMTWIGVNPFGRIPYHLTRLTEPLVRPFRYQFSNRIMRYDLIPLLTGVLILVLGLSISGLVGQLALVLDAIGKNITNGAALSWVMMGELINLIGLLYVIAIFLRFLLPFFGVGYSNKFYHFLFAITEPLIKPLRRFFVFGMMDFSPIIVMFIIQFITPVLAGIVAGFGR
ncbi:MAG: YggT family protein [Blastocatellia bacterium]